MSVSNVSMRGCTQLLLLIGTLLLPSGISTLSAVPKIAIVGGGIGGASAAHYLNELFGGKLRIDLYEADKIGGRLATVDIAGAEYEAGGSVIHRRNLLMKHFVKLLGMEERPSCGHEKFAIWNGNEFVFEQSTYEIGTLTKLIYRYGLQPFRLDRYVGSILDDFEKIYELHDSGVAFANVTALLAAMNTEFPNMLRASMKQHLTNLGYTSRIIDELVQATLVVNYGQDTDVPSFVGCVSVAGAGSSLWSVNGGNKDVPKHLIYRSGRVNVVPAVVKKIVHLPRNAARSRYELHYRDNGHSVTTYTTYDTIIIATPLTRDHETTIDFEGFPSDANLHFPGTYQTTFATFVHGDLNPKYFDSEDPIGAVLSCDPNRTIVSSVASLLSVQGSCSKVWKIFSRDPLERRLIDDMFSQVDHVKTIRWKAYPKYSTSEPRRLDFRLHDSLYHVNAIEWAASAMEMSAIAGRNVAILTYNDYNGTDESDPPTISSSSETKRLKLDESVRFLDL